MNDGNQIRFEGHGDPGPTNTPHGDLILTIRVRPHKTFQRNGDDIYIGKEISFVQAVLGDEIEIPVVDPNSGNGESTTRLKIPSGTQQGTDIRIKGKGMPHLRSTSRGDMYVRVFVTIPQKISKEQKKLLEEYRSIK